MPLISIIVPVYKAEAFLRKCRDNLLNCDECECTEEECIKEIYENAKNYFDWE